MLLQQEMDVSDQRQHARIPYVEAVQYQFQNVEVHEGTLACDLSQGGIRMHTNDFIPVGTVLVVKLRFKGSVQLVDVIAKVQWVRVIPYSERFQVGLEFTDAKIDRLMRIGQYVDQNLSA